MMGTPTFTIYKHVFEIRGEKLGDKEGEFMGRPSQRFADTIVSDLLSRPGVGLNVIKEAILGYHMWIATSFELNQVWSECMVNNNSTRALAALDRVATFWFGDGENGVSLSQLTDSISRTAFGQIGEEVWANLQIINSLDSLKKFLAREPGCMGGSQGGSSPFRVGVNRLQSLMSIPLVQKLVHSTLLTNADENLVQVYMDILYPQVMACDPEIADSILVDRASSMTNEQKAAWAKHVLKALGCLRLDCEEIGVYTQGSLLPGCTEQSQVSLAGYESSSVDAKYFSFIDRDLNRLEILLHQKAYISALDHYLQGYHAPFSLQQLASNAVVSSQSVSTSDRYVCIAELSTSRDVIKLNKFMLDTSG